MLQPGLQNEWIKCGIELGFPFSLVLKRFLHLELNLDRLSQLNAVNCQSFRHEPRKDETPDTMELAQKRSQDEKGQMGAGKHIEFSCQPNPPLQELCQVPSSHGECQNQDGNWRWVFKGRAQSIKSP